MSIHDFHSKLMSGSEEGNLFQALRKLITGGPLLATGEEPAMWSVWTESSDSSASSTLGWTVWQDGSEGLSQA